MRRDVWFATLFFVVSIAMLLSYLYWFLVNEGFCESNFLVASAMVLAVAVGWGYIIATHLLEPKKQIEENLSYLVDEIIHELNIPLSTIDANSSMLKRALNEDRKALKRIERIEASSKRLKKLYDELIYSIKKEMREIPKEEFNLKELIEERVEVFEEQKRNPFVLHLEDCIVFADKIGFEQILDNLILNSMKYSHKLKPISIILKRDILEIIDEGIGIDETQLLRVHERYYQGDSTKEGKGIGLSLVKAYCDEERIGVQIDSKVGKGTHVVLHLNKIVHR